MNQYLTFKVVLADTWNQQQTVLVIKSNIQDKKLRCMLANQTQ